MASLSAVNEALYPMRVVVARTGLTSHVIRVWERRYRAVVPHRTETNRRLYTEADIRRLHLLRRAVESGQAISQLASLSDTELESIIESAPPPPPRTHGVEPPGSPSADDYVQLALAASISLDARELRAVLGRAEMDLGRYPLIARVIAPLLEKIGELWRRGEMRPSQEHMTSSVIHQVLGDAMAHRMMSDGAPAILMATPSGHSHELGCLMAANAAEMMGWRTVYLGADLPAEEIAQAARRSGARAVGLSLVYPSRSPQTLAEIERLRQLLPEDMTLLIGGRVGPSYAGADLPGTVFVNDLDEMRLALQDLD